MSQRSDAQEKVKEFTERLEKGVQDVFKSDNYELWLKTCSRFHRYSIRNQMSILLTRPDATLCAGYQSWLSMGRHRRKGEHGIPILVPTPVKVREIIDAKDPVTGKVKVDSAGKPQKEIVEHTVPRYKVGYVFDISQTEGRELPKLVNALEGSVDGYERMVNALQKVSPVPISFEPIQGSANGYYHLEDKSIVVKKGMSEQQTIKTMIHEITHASLHDPDLDPEAKTKQRADQEIEAESVAYVVCQYYGIDSSQYSFGYVTSWAEGKELAQLHRSMQTISKTANSLIERTDAALYSEKIAEKAQDDLKEMIPGTIGKDVFQKKDLDKEPVMAKPRRR